MIALVSFSMAANYDIKPSDISMQWTAFKTAKKVGVSGDFDKIVYDIPNKKDRGTLVKALKKAKATIQAVNLNIGDNKLKYDNVYSTLFKSMKTDIIEATIYDLMEGEGGIGTILLEVKMNKRNNKIPMQYEIKDNVLVAKGTLDMLDFNLGKGRKALVKKYGAYHEGVTWTQVNLELSIKL